MRSQMGRPKRVSDRAVLDAAARVIGRRGPVDFTVREVGDEAGLSAAAVMQRFGTKRRILLALSAGARVALDEAFDAAEREATSPLDAVADALTRLATSVATSGDPAHHVAFFALDVADPELRALARSHFAEFRARVRRLVEAARERGDIAADIDADALARLAEVAYNGALVTWALERREPVNALLREALAPMFGPTHGAGRREAVAD